MDKARLRNYDLVCDTTRASAAEVIEHILAAYEGRLGADVLRTAPPMLLLDPARIFPTEEIQRLREALGRRRSSATGAGRRRRHLEPLKIGYTGEHFYVVDGHAGSAPPSAHGFKVVPGAPRRRGRRAGRRGPERRRLLPPARSARPSIDDWEAAHGIRAARSATRCSPPTPAPPDRHRADQRLQPAPPPDPAPSRYGRAGAPGHSVDWYGTEPSATPKEPPRVTVQPIRLFGDPVLRTPAEPVVDFDKELRRLVADLTDTHAGRRAAPGWPRRSSAWGCGSSPSTWTTWSGTWSTRCSSSPTRRSRTARRAACPSPALYFDTKRRLNVVAKGFNEYGEPMQIVGTGLMARCVQHETDHLDGVLFIDRLDPQARKEAMKAIRPGRLVRPPTRPPVVKVSPHADGSPFGLRR